MKVNLNTIFSYFKLSCFYNQKNVSRVAQSNEESEDSVSTADDATESSDESSPEDYGTVKLLQQPINQLFEKWKKIPPLNPKQKTPHTTRTINKWQSQRVVTHCIKKFSCDH